MLPHHPQPSAELQLEQLVSVEHAPHWDAPPAPNTHAEEQVCPLDGPEEVPEKQVDFSGHQPHPPMDEQLEQLVWAEQLPVEGGVDELEALHWRETEREREEFQRSPCPIELPSQIYSSPHVCVFHLAASSLLLSPSVSDLIRAPVPIGTDARRRLQPVSSLAHAGALTPPAARRPAARGAREQV